MDEAEVDIVAAELAKIGGTSWYPGREDGPILRVVTERYRDRARAAIAALDRHRSAQENGSRAREANADTDVYRATTSGIKVGATVVYRPPGDRRAYPCTIEKINDDLVYLVPKFKSTIGWVPAADILTNANFMKDLQSEEGPKDDLSGK